MNHSKLNLNLSLTSSLTDESQYSKGFQFLVKDVKDKFTFFNNIIIYIYTHTMHTHHLYIIINIVFFTIIINPIIACVSAEKLMIDKINL